MNGLGPLRLGVALATTVGAGYALCTLAFRLWPDAAANFMSALFHGLDFRKLQTGWMLSGFGDFAYALAILMAWAFGLGVLFGWLSGKVGRER